MIHEPHLDVRNFRVLPPEIRGTRQALFFLLNGEAAVERAQIATASPALREIHRAAAVAVPRWGETLSNDNFEFNF